MDGTGNVEATWPAFARGIMEQILREPAGTPVVPPAGEVTSYGGVFVTLRKFGRLRGCMGTLDTTRPLLDAVRHAALSAAFHDPRFPPVGLDELRDVTLEVSILSEAWPMRTLDDLELGRHGIVVRCGLRQGLFLPQVATEHRLDKETFLSRCCSEKAGLPAQAWRDADTQVLLFTTQVYSEAGTATDSHPCPPSNKTPGRGDSAEPQA